MKVTEQDGQFITEKLAGNRKKSHFDFRLKKLKESKPVESQFFGKEKLLKLLSKEKCVGLKIIYGISEDGLPNLILVAADAELNNLETDAKGLKGRDDDSYLSNGPQCPNICNQ
jgi:hypothetical protein